MSRRAFFVACIAAVAVGALAFRLPRLSSRPMHGDEAVEAFKTGLLFDSGFYRYDPTEYHGPTLHYATLPFLYLGGASSFADSREVHYRLVPVAFGVGLVLLVLLVGDGLGRPAAVVAGILTAVSPAMVYYSRYYIHEMLLVFFTFAAIACGWRYAWTRRVGWAIATGAALGLMHATKETCVLAYAAMALAILGKLTWRKWWGYPINVRAVVRGRDLALALASAAVVSLVLFSSFFTNWRGPLDSVLTYANYFRRSGGAGLHAHPWNYYLKLLLATQVARGPLWSEALIIGLAVVGFVAVMWRESVPEANTPLARFVAFYTLFLTALYAIIPYKTPWCLLSFLHGMILLAGIGAAVVVRLVPTHLLKGAACLALGVGIFHLGVQAHRAAFRFSAHRANPYVYAHTSSDALNIARRAEQIAAVHPDGREMVIKIIAPEADYWPLPWYLRRFPNVGYWLTPPENPEEGQPAMFIVAERLDDQFKAKLKGDYFVECRGLRPTVHMAIYIRRNLWNAFIERQRRASQASALCGRRPT